MPLTTVGAGRRVRFVSVNGGHRVRGMLTSMGLVPGVEIEVLQNSPHGPFLIAVKGSRIALGRGVAHKIVVE